MYSIYSEFREKVVAMPDAMAVQDGSRALTYEQLDALADTIATGFPTRNPAFVGIVMDHSVEMIASILAVLKTGAAYVPAEPSFPIERIRYMMKESDVDFIITHGKYVDYINHGFRKMTVECGQEIVPADVDNCSSTDALAYILYTSGTTGNPKGVQVTNANVCHYVRAFSHEFNPGPGDRMLQYSVCSFDIFVEEVFTTLLNGATLVIPSEEAKKDVRKLLGFCSENGITMISGFPYLLAEMNKMPELLPESLRLLISGGDVLRAKYISKLKDKVMIYNTYGPSETTVCASYFRADNAEPLADGTFPVGTPILGTQIEIMDKDLKPVKNGETGEICIFGDGVSRGYLGSKPENENFTATPDGRKVYLSGDLGYILPDGNIAFLRRKDKQVMILGKRVESDEVENVLCTCSEVEDAVVCPATDTEGLSYLVAYVVPRKGKFNLTELRRKLSQYLTPFMIPEFFVAMPSFPMTPNGKVDRKSLPVVLKEGALYA